MARVIYVQPDGGTRSVDVLNGQSVMEGATRNNVAGILADCGGACSCATCHVYVDEAWIDRVGPPSALEESMLEYAEGVAANSRLSCQIRMTDAIDGLVVQIPQSQ